MGYSYAGAYGVGEVLSNVLLFVFLGIYLLILAFSVTSYILTARGMQVIARRRGIRHSWLAWIPLGNAWILGSISDQYQYVVKGKVRNRRKVLLILNLLSVCGGIPAYLISYVSSVNQLSGIVNPGIAAIGSFVLVTVATTLLIVVLSIVQAIFVYIAYYDLFASCEPKNAVVYLILSIFVSVTMPFFVFACRKKDLGMPPRKEAQPEPLLAAPVAEAPVPEVPAAEPAMEEPAAEEPAAEEPAVEAPAEEEASAPDDL